MYNKTTEVGKIGDYYFANINNLVDSDVNIVTKVDNSNNYLITKVYKMRTKGSIIVETMALWNPLFGLHFKNDFEMISSRRRKNFTGVTLQTSIVITNNDTFNHLTDKR